MLWSCSHNYHYYCYAKSFKNLLLKISTTTTYQRLLWLKFQIFSYKIYNWWYFLCPLHRPFPLFHNRCITSWFQQDVNCQKYTSDIMALQQKLVQIRVHAVVNIQLNIVTSPTYPETLTRTQCWSPREQVLVLEDSRGQFWSPWPCDSSPLKNSRTHSSPIVACFAGECSAVCC